MIENQSYWQELRDKEIEDYNNDYLLAEMEAVAVLSLQIDENGSVPERPNG